MNQTANGSRPDQRQARQAYLDLRSWLKRLEETGRLAIARRETDLQFALAGIANRNDGERATVFPHPSGHSGSVVSGLLSQRAWMAEGDRVTPSGPYGHPRAVHDAGARLSRSL